MCAIDKDFRNYEYLKDETGFRVADRVLDIKRSFNTIVDLGCSRGYVSKHFTKETVKKVYMLDMSESMLENAYTPEDGIELVKLVHDEEANLPFEDNSIDLFVSNLSLHWVNKLPSVFGEVMRCLRKDGALIGSMFAGDTLYELRVAIQLAEQERKGVRPAADDHD